MKEKQTEEKELIWHNEKRKVSALIPWALNPRQLTAAQAKNLMKSLDKFGLVDLPSINTDNVLLGGHARCKILALLGRGAEEIEVRVPSRKLTDSEVMELNLRLNKNGGEFDFDALANNFDTELLMDVGFSKKEIDFDMEGDDEKEEGEAGVKTNQLFHVVVDCHDEAEQKDAIDKLTTLGFKCSVMEVKEKKKSKAKTEKN